SGPQESFGGVEQDGSCASCNCESPAPSRDAVRAFYCMNTSIAQIPISTHQRVNPMPRLTNLQYAATCKDDDPIDERKRIMSFFSETNIGSAARREQGELLYAFLEARNRKSLS